MTPVPRLLTAAPLFFLPWIARADLLQLANGDRLQGKLVTHEAGTIRWENPVLGVLTVPDTRATIVPEVAAQTPAGPTPKPADAKHASSERAKSDKPASAKPADTHWKTKVESGFALKSGRGDRMDVNLRTESTLQRKRNSYRVLARYLYSKANGSTTTDRTEASFRWRRELDARWFGQTNTSYLSAKVRGIDHNVEQNLGFGYRVLKSDRTNASIGTGLTGQYREIHDAGNGQSLFGEVFQDFTFKLNERLDIGEDFTAQYSPSGRNVRILPNGSIQIIETEVTNYKMALNAFLRGKLTESLSLALRYEFEFDNTYVSDTEKTDQRITTSLGYSF